MAGFNFERNLPHQKRAVDSVLATLASIVPQKDARAHMAHMANPSIPMDSSQFSENLCVVQSQNNLTYKWQKLKSRVLDVCMETGTGKTYTYTKMMFELHKHHGISKFIIVVPTLSIKAGTLSFLKAPATKEHFRSEYDTEIKTYVVESKKSSKKNAKNIMPQSVKTFVEASLIGGKCLHVMIINQGMLNSATMSQPVDVTLFDEYNTPFDAIASIKPLTIVDEPHKFKQENTSWENLQKFASQYIIRFGATFDEKYENLIYRLSAVDAFNEDLVKGVVTHVERFTEGSNALVTLKAIEGKEAIFELNRDGMKHHFKIAHKESLSTIDAQMQGLYVENLNKTTVVLSNGLELKKNDKINPSSFAQSLQDSMMQKAIKKHFEIERDLLTRDVKIKPLTLFFIDDIAGYRVGEHQISGSLKEKFEIVVKAHATELLKTETDPFYKAYLEKTLHDVSLTHGGYFSKDNSESDEKIEKEIEEILHDKESLLSLDNPRRFIFSKWTLREGWDNPNVFQICKLRSSGSKTSKLQEVGRGLRLPVNQYMSRVKDETFDLHYYVDFTEQDFVEELIGEINQNSGIAYETAPTKLSEAMIEKIIRLYHDYDKESLCEYLVTQGITKFSLDFKENGFKTIKELFPKAFREGLKEDKVRSNEQQRHKIGFREGKYAQLQELWESINQKVILEYKIENEALFEKLLEKYFLDNAARFKPQGIMTQTNRLDIENGEAIAKPEQSLHDDILPIVTMSYKAFLQELSLTLHVNLLTLHTVLRSIQPKLDINLYRNMSTIRSIKSGFTKFLLDNSLSTFDVSYTKVSNAIHPTKFTDANGKVLESINASDVGVHYSSEHTASNYLFKELFYDSDLEKENIKTGIAEVIVFTKIPKNSIRIPVAGGESYSPDFAYIVKQDNGMKNLHLVIETKDKEGNRSLFSDEIQKIKHAQKLFGDTVKVQFKTQFKDDEMREIIKTALKNTEI